MIIVATTSLPAVDRPNADRCNAARSCQLKYLKSSIKVFKIHPTFQGGWVANSASIWIEIDLRLTANWGWAWQWEIEIFLHS